MKRQITNGCLRTKMEECFKEAISQLGYSGRVAPFPKQHLENEKMANFLSWVVKQLNRANVVSPSELAR